MHIHMYIIYICIYICIYMYICMYMFKDTYTHVYECISLYIYIQMYKSVCIHVYTHIHVIHIYIYIHIYHQTSTKDGLFSGFRSQKTSSLGVPTPLFAPATFPLRKCTRRTSARAGSGRFVTRGTTFDGADVSTVSQRSQGVRHAKGKASFSAWSVERFTPGIND